MQKDRSGVLKTFQIVILLQPFALFAFQSSEFDSSLWITVGDKVYKFVANTTDTVVQKDPLLTDIRNTFNDWNGSLKQIEKKNTS